VPTARLVTPAGHWRLELFEQTFLGEEPQQAGTAGLQSIARQLQGEPEPAAAKGSWVRESQAAGLGNGDSTKRGWPWPDHGLEGVEAATGGTKHRRAIWESVLQANIPFCIGCRFRAGKPPKQALAQSIPHTGASGSDQVCPHERQAGVNIPPRRSMAETSAGGLRRWVRGHPQT